MQCMLYIHVPFCRSRCRYCDFYSVTETGPIVDRYIDAVAREWELRTAGQEIELSSVFIGGGTPSLLTVEQWCRFNEVLLGKLPLAKDAEWTVECNPESITATKMRLLADIGVDRLTIGIQSTAERELAIAGRPHNPEQAAQVLAIEELRAFRSVGVDVMYGLPGQTTGSLTDTLRTLLDMPVVGHLSAYELTLAENTSFGRHATLLPLPSEDDVSAMYAILRSETRRYGFRQYEISNFARGGFESVHNRGYWNHTPYVGLGCAAHSWVPPVRSWNKSDVLQYCVSLEGGTLPVERCEQLDAGMIAREMLFLGLRTTEGVDENVFESVTGMKLPSGERSRQLVDLREDGMLEHCPPFWRPTEKGLLFADYMARELF